MSQVMPRTMKVLKQVVLIWGLACASFATGQGLLDELDSLVDEQREFVQATFKDSRIVNAQSNETPGEGILHFVIAHRFGRINEGIYSLWGLDNASMRLGLDFGVTDRLAIGVARSTYQKTLEVNAKYRLVRQSEGAREVPLSVTLYSVGMMNGLRWAEPERENLFSSRLSYVHQIVVARKMGQRLSLACIPSLTHRNLVPTESDPHDALTLGVGGRYKLNNRLSINGEWHPFLTHRPAEVMPSLSLGVDIDTGGHVFQLHVTNAQGMFERAFLTETGGSWLDGALYFGFNLSRVFTLAK